MRKLTQMQPKKRLVICKDSTTPQARPIIGSSSNIKKMELPQLPRELLNGHEITEKQIKAHQEQIEAKIGLSLSKLKKQNSIYVGERKKSMSNGNLTTLNTIQTRKSIRMKCKGGVLEGLVCDLVEKIKLKATKLSIYDQFLVDRNCLEEVLMYLIRVIVNTDLALYHMEHSSLAGFQPLIEKIQVHALFLLNQSKHKRLNLDPNVHSIAATSLDYHIEQENRALSIKNHLQKIKQLQEKIQELAFKRQNLDDQYLQVKNMLAQKKELQSQIQALTSRLECLDIRERKKRNDIQLLEQEAKKIQNFVNVQQNRQLLKMASQEYRQIEEDIYEYAVYLQSNQLASSLSYQPLPFDHLEAQLMQQTKQFSVNNCDSSSQKSQEENCLLRISEFYRKKDKQMQKLLEFKTKCIRQFVANMKKWLQNWELKQEFLVNLRKEFGSLSRKMTLQMQAISSQQLCSTCSMVFKDNMKELAGIYESIEENYCLGNSFY